MKYILDSGTANIPVLRWVTVSSSTYNAQKAMAEEKNRSVFVRDLLDRPNESEDEFAAPTLYEAINWLEETFGYHINVTWNKESDRYDYFCQYDDRVNTAGGFHIPTKVEALNKALNSALYTVKRKQEKKQDS